MRIASSVELRNQYGGDAGQYNATFTLQEPRQTPLGRTWRNNKVNGPGIRGQPTAL